MGMIFSSFAFAASSYYPITYSASNYGFDNIVAIASDSQGNIWVGAGNSSKHTILTKIPFNATNQPVVYSEPLPLVANLVVDRYGNVWGNSYDNTVAEYPANNPTDAITYSSSQYDFDYPTSIATDKKGNIWITNRGSYNGQSSYLTEIPVSNPGNPIIYSGASYNFGQGTIGGITADPQGNIWVINGSGGVTELPVGNPNNPIVYSGLYKPSNTWPSVTPIISDKNGNIWFPGSIYTNTMIELPANNPDNPVVYSNGNYAPPLAMTSDNQGNIWLTESVYLGVQGIVIEIPAANPNDPIVYSDSGGNYNFDYPIAITADPNGNIWVVNSNYYSEASNVIELMKTKSS